MEYTTDNIKIYRQRQRIRELEDKLWVEKQGNMSLRNLLDRRYQTLGILSKLGEVWRMFFYKER